MAAGVELGAFPPDQTGAGIAVLATLVACAVVAGAVASRGRGRGFRRLAVVFAAALTAVLVFLQLRIEPAALACDDEISSVVRPSDDGAFGFSIGVCDPFGAEHFAVLHLARTADGKEWNRRLPLPRSERDDLTLGAEWGRLTALGRRRYWWSPRPRSPGLARVSTWSMLAGASPASHRCAAA